ncbi:MAG: hypothetical protein ACYDCK_05280 [Thermoplasmatota archaeon]
MPVERGLREQGIGTRVLLLVVAVAVATAVGSVGGGALGKLVSRAQGGVGDDLVFAGLAWGGIAALVLSVATGIVVAPRLAFSRWLGAAVGLLAFAALVSLYVGPWRVF